RKCGPSEGTRTTTKKRTNKSRHKSRKIKCFFHSPKVGHPSAQVVSIIEGYGSFLLHFEHGFNMRYHRIKHVVLISFWIFFTLFGRFIKRIPGRNIPKL